MNIFGLDFPYITLRKKPCIFNYSLVSSIPLAIEIYKSIYLLYNSNYRGLCTPEDYTSQRIMHDRGCDGPLV